MEHQDRNIDYASLACDIKEWAKELGFQQLGIADTELSLAESRLQQWLDLEHHGSMGYMAHHGSKRSRPAELVPGTLRVLSVRLDYLPPEDDPQAILDDRSLAYVSRYALGRDYHKPMRNRLQKLAHRIEQAIGPFGYRAFVDSAPVMEKPLAVKAGLGWMGKHCNIIHQRAGGWFFLGELYVDLPLPPDLQESDHCGLCTACITACPTRAIVAPYRVDARRCISYLTIEHDGPIDEELRPLMGNRIYGCDDCLLACPWNRFAKTTREQDFLPRNSLEASALSDLFGWTEKEFLTRLEGSPIRRIGHQRWLRNLAIALGNAPPDEKVRKALEARKNDNSELVREHVDWALRQQSHRE
jgi:epoxyqueuosine reductase